VTMGRDETWRQKTGGLRPVRVEATPEHDLDGEQADLKWPAGESRNVPDPIPVRPAMDAPPEVASAGGDSERG